MKKVALIMLGIVLFVVAVGFGLKACHKASEPPTLQEAPWIVQAGTRYLYARDYTEGTDGFGRFVILKDYWDTTDGEKWQYHKGDLRLSERGFGTITVKVREQNRTPFSP